MAGITDPPLSRYAGIGSAGVTKPKRAEEIRMLESARARAGAFKVPYPKWS